MAKMIRRCTPKIKRRYWGERRVCGQHEQEQAIQADGGGRRLFDRWVVCCVCACRGRAGRTCSGCGRADISQRKSQVKN